MAIVAIVLAAVIAIAVVVFVALPFLREPEPTDDSLTESSDEEKARIGLVEERDRGLAALTELEFDHRTRKISTADYKSQVSILRGQAAAAIQALDEQSGRPAPQEALAREANADSDRDS